MSDRPKPGPWQQSRLPGGPDQRLYEYTDGHRAWEYSNRIGTLVFSPDRFEPRTVPAPGKQTNTRDTHYVTERRPSVVSAGGDGRGRILQEIVVGTSRHDSGRGSNQLHAGNPSFTIPQTHYQTSTHYQTRGPTQPTRHASVTPVTSQTTTKGSFTSPPLQDVVQRSQPFRSSLGPTARYLADIKVGDYAQCRKLLSEIPSIGNTNPKTFLMEAITAFSNGKTGYARSCVQASVLLNELQDLDEKEADDFLDDLVDGAKDSLRYFINEFDRVCNLAKLKASQPAASATSQSGDQRPELQGARQPLQPDHNFPISSPGNPTSPANRHGHEGVDTIPTAQFSQLSVHRPSGAASGATDWVRHESSLAGDNPGALFPRPAPSNRHEPSVTGGHEPTASGRGNRNRNSAETVISTIPSISGGPGVVPGSREELDPRYYVRDHAHNFFKVGRVFAVLWHEGAGESRSRPYLSEDTRFVGRYGQSIYSTIRRMVVVKERHGYVLCCPVNTYGGRGLWKSGFKKADINAHSLIHMDTTKPEYLDSQSRGREPRSTKTHAITVKSAAADQKLDKASRIRFDTVHTVQHNVKVMNVGRVTQESLPYLTRYWKEEMDD